MNETWVQVQVALHVQQTAPHTLVYVMEYPEQQKYRR